MGVYIVMCVFARMRMMASYAGDEAPVAVYMCVCVCVCMCVYIYVQVCVHNIYIYIYTHTHMYILHRHEHVVIHLMQNQIMIEKSKTDCCKR